MNLRIFAVLVALTAGSCTIPLDPQSAGTIPTEIALAKLQELLPKASYVSCMEPRVTVDQADIQAWTVNPERLEFRSGVRVPFKLWWSQIRGVELVQVLARYEVRIFAAVPGSAKKDLYHFNWNDEDEARRAAELFESLRGDR
jgi:hypothetical protein